MKILNQDDFKRFDTKGDLLKISANEIRIKEIDDIWDGPLSGLCEWNGGEYYFFAFDQLEDDGSGDRWPRKYVLIRLTEENVRARSMLKEQTGMQEVGQHINKDQIIGWFDSEPQGAQEQTKFLKSYFELK